MNEWGEAIEPTLTSVPLGQGKRFFSEGTPVAKLSLLATKTSPTGVLINSYEVH